MTKSTPNDQLVAYLRDVHSIEEQALTQMRAAPKIAGDPELAEAFAAHLAETEDHERMVRERLRDHGESPSTVKDLAGQAGGIGMVLFARSQPDTPGKLAAHAYAYEHMELAAYALLRQAAQAAGDAETERAALAIEAQERLMGERLAALFDRAAEASLRELDPDDLGSQLDAYLRDAHAIERQAQQLLEAGPDLVDDEELARAMAEHLEETREHLRRVDERLEARGSKASAIKDAALHLGGKGVGAFFGAQPDTTAKLAGFAYAFEHLEIAGYELLARVAARAGDARTEAMAREILAEERAAAERVAGTWSRVMRAEIGATTA